MKTSRRLASLCFVTLNMICGLFSAETGLFIAETNTRFLSSAVVEMDVKSETECSLHCLDKYRKYWKSCHSVNFFKPNNTCEINEINAYYPTIGTKDSEYGWTLWTLQYVWEPHCSNCACRYNEGFTQSGVYSIFPLNSSSPVFVYCDQDTDGGGWTVFQNRVDGSVEFYRNWTDYKTGFGDPYGEYWMGNDALQLLTAQDESELRIELTNFNNGSAYATYSNFSVSGESNEYRLTVTGYSGTAGESFSYKHSGMKFSTFDNDNDSHGSANCAQDYSAGWWFQGCLSANLNGIYAGSAVGSNPHSMCWRSWETPSILYETMKRSQMKVRPVTFI